MANKGDGGFQPTGTDPILMGPAGVPQYPFTVAHTAQTQFTQAANGLDYAPRSDIEPKRTTGEMREFPVLSEYDAEKDGNLGAEYPAPSASAPSPPAPDDLTRASEVVAPEIEKQAQGTGGVSHIVDNRPPGAGYGDPYKTPGSAPSGGYGGMAAPQPHQYGPPSGGYGYPPAPGYNGQVPMQPPYSSGYGSMPTGYPQQVYGTQPGYPNMPPSQWVAPNQQPNWSSEQVTGNPGPAHAANSTHLWNH